MASDADSQLLLGSDPLDVVSDALARAGETFELASRHLDPSLVDVLADPRLRPRVHHGAAAPISTTPTAARTSTSTPARASRASATTTPTSATVLEATLAASLADGVQIHYSPLAGMLAEALAAATARRP